MQRLQYNYWVFGAVVVSSLVLSSCVTPLGPGEIERLTTCRGIGLREVRKNLLMSGYTIATQSEDHITTEYKQVGGRRERRELMRLNVVQLDANTVRFQPHYREEGFTSVRTTDVAAYSPKEKRPTIAIAHDQIIPVEDEYDETYYQEYLSRYEDLQRLVCGGKF